MNNDLTVVILAAGLGTRMKSKKAKVLHEAGGMALVEHVVDSALAVTNPDRVVVVVGHQAEAVKAKLQSRGIRFALQAEQKGTGHALEMCRDQVGDQGERLVVLYGDTPLLSVSTLEGLFKHHESSGASATVITAELEDATGYGRIIRSSQGFIQAIVEHKVATPEQRAVREINSGIYAFDADLLWKHLREVKVNPVSGEYYLTDIVELFNAAGLKVSPLLHNDADELLGINTRIELALVDKIFRTRKATELMLAGVTMIKPETIAVDSKVTVGMDSIIEPFAQLLGSTTVGADCRIGTGVILRDTTLGDGVIINPYTIINKSTVGDGADVGPFARLRIDNHVGAKAHIGNFVELKKTNFGEGAKAGHLAYLGDSDIAPKVNIGAGTITCNYDGVNKHKTELGPGAFIGSNSTLVAPVKVGDGAYIAAGSVVTDEVPADALAIGRGRQVNKEEWAKKRREPKK